MPLPAVVTIHPSQFPQAVEQELLRSLRTRQVNHKFHYDSPKQTQKWLALHETHSPARNDKDVMATYGQAFAGTAARIKGPRVQVIGLGCGGGQKDVQLLKLLRSCHKTLFYTPCDVSTPMVLVAREATLKIIPSDRCFTFVSDLATANDLPGAMQKCLVSNTFRLITFFGLIPNFEPDQILPKLTLFTRPKDILLFSANLAPGSNYTDGLKKILPQYDNTLTRDWLMTFLFDLGVENRDGDLRFEIETGAFGLKRVVARFHFRRSRTVHVAASRFHFRTGDSIRLFFSYRYTPERVKAVLKKFGLVVGEQWVTKSGEEGVFFCHRGNS